MSMIFCNINLGMMDQILIEVKNGFYNPIQTVNLAQLQEAIPSLCYSLNIFEVRLKGNRAYLEGLINLIQNNEITLYNSNKINIEVVE